MEISKCYKSASFSPTNGEGPLLNIYQRTTDYTVSPHFSRSYPSSNLNRDEYGLELRRRRGNAAERWYHKTQTLHSVEETSHYTVPAHANMCYEMWQGFPGGAVVENLPANAGNTGSSPGLGRSHMPWSN